MGERTAIDGLSAFLGMRWRAIDECRLTIRPELINPGGRLTGPVSFALIDYTMGSVLYAQLAEGEAIATTNLAINYVATATEGEIVCRTWVDRRTRSAASLGGEVRHEDGRLLSTAIGSFAIFPRKRERPGGPFS